MQLCYVLWETVVKGDYDSCLMEFFFQNIHYCHAIDFALFAFMPVNARQVLICDV